MIDHAGTINLDGQVAKMNRWVVYALQICGVIIYGTQIFWEYVSTLSESVAITIVMKFYYVETLLGDIYSHSAVNESASAPKTWEACRPFAWEV